MMNTENTNPIPPSSNEEAKASKAEEKKPVVPKPGPKDPRQLDEFFDELQWEKLR